MDVLGRSGSFCFCLFFSLIALGVAPSPIFAAGESLKAWQNPPQHHSAHPGSPSAAPATKSAFRGSQKPLRLPRNLRLEVHHVLRLPRNLRFELHQVQRLPPNRCIEGYKVLCLSRNLHFEVHKFQSAPPATKSANAPHVEKLRFIAPVTPRRSHAPVTKSAPATKSDHHVRKCTRGRFGAPAAATQISRACAVEMYLEDSERHERIANSSELAVHARAPQ